MGNTLEKSDMLPEKENSSSSRLKNNSSIKPEQQPRAMKLLFSAVVWKEIIRQIQYFSFLSIYFFIFIFRT